MVVDYALLDNRHIIFTHNLFFTITQAIYSYLHQTFLRQQNLNPTTHGNITLYTGAYGESWSPRCLLVSVDLLAALGAIRAAQRQSAKNFWQILVLLE